MNKNKGARYHIAKFSFSMKKRIDLYEQIRAMTDEGIPIIDVITSLESIYKSENKNDQRVYILGRWRKAMENHGSLLKEIRHWIPESEVVMFKTAEETGEWVKCLDNLIFQVEKQSEIKKIVVSQMVYPIFLTMFLVIIMFVFGKYGVPMLSEMLPVNRWPEFSMPLHNISVFIASYIHFVVFGLLAFLYFVFKVQNRYVGKARRHLDRLPPYNVYKAMQGASFLISLASLLKAGVPVIDAVKIIEENSSPWVKSKIKNINKAFNKGDTGAGALISGGGDSMFSRDIRIQIKAYSQLAQMDRSIYKIGIVAIGITADNVRAITGLVKMLMILCVAISIVWIYASFIQVSMMAAQVV